MKTLIYIAISIRVITNLIPFNWVYFIGVDIFEIIVLYVLYRTFESNILEQVLMLCIGCCVWNLFKPLLVDVTKFDPYEIGGFFIGLIIIFAQYVKKPNT